MITPLITHCKRADAQRAYQQPATSPPAAPTCSNLRASRRTTNAHRGQAQGKAVKSAVHAVQKPLRPDLAPCPCALHHPSCALRAPHPIFSVLSRSTCCATARIGHPPCCCARFRGQTRGARGAAAPVEQLGRCAAARLRPLPAPGAVASARLRTCRSPLARSGGTSPGTVNVPPTQHCAAKWAA